MSGGQFDWGGRLLKSNGGARWWAQNGRKSFAECNGISLPDCETDKSSRDESRSVVTPFVQVGTYPTRNFATLGPL